MVVYTRKGNLVDLVNPYNTVIDVDDIAWALSNINRFGGHAKLPINVASHSLMVSRFCAVIAKSKGFDAAEIARVQLAGLCHDFAEAYLGDIPAPLKAVVPEFKNLEKTFDRVIRSRLNLPHWDVTIVHKADWLALLIEAENATMIPMSQLNPSMDEVLGDLGLGRSDLAIGPVFLPPAAARETLVLQYRILKQYLAEADTPVSLAEL